MYVHGTLIQNFDQNQIETKSLVTRKPGSRESPVSRTPGSRFLTAQLIFFKLQAIATAFKATNKTKNSVNLIFTSPIVYTFQMALGNV